MSWCLCIRFSEEVYELYCVDCRASLGTFTGEGMLKAMRHPASVGGVKCPECRQKTCTNCGQVQEGENTLIKGLCWWCSRIKEEGDDQRLKARGLMARAAAPLSSSSNLHADSQKGVGHD